MSQENLFGNQQNTESELVFDTAHEQEQISRTPLLDSIIDPTEQSDTLRAARSLILVLGDAAAETRALNGIRRDMDPKMVHDTMVHVEASIDMTLTDARNYASLPGEYIADGMEVQAADLLEELILSQREGVMPRVAESLKRDIVEKQADLARYEQAYQDVLLSLTPEAVLERSYTVERAPDDVQELVHDSSVSIEAKAALADKDTRISTGRLVKILGSTVMSLFSGHNDKPHAEQSLDDIRKQPLGIMGIINRS